MTAESNRFSQLVSRRASRSPAPQNFEIINPFENQPNPFANHKFTNPFEGQPDPFANHKFVSSIKGQDTRRPAMPVPHGGGTARRKAIRVRKPRNSVGNWETLKKSDPTSAIWLKTRPALQKPQGREFRGVLSPDGIQFLLDLIYYLLIHPIVKVGELIVIVIDGMGKFVIQVTPELIDRLRQTHAKLSEMMQYKMSDLDRWLFENGAVITIGGYIVGTILFVLTFGI